MLASALNSHPELTFGGEGLDAEYFAEQSRNCIIHLPFCSPRADKYIALVRPVDDRIMSMRASGLRHVTLPDTVIECEPVNIPASYEHQAMLEQFIEDNDCLVLHYDQITGGKDCRAIPQSHEICDFLGISYRVLVPATYKPQNNTRQCPHD